MEAPFQHQRLDRSTREIRLLKLLPKAQWPHNSLPTCSMFHTSIDQCLPYLALSYVWGDTSDPKKILVNGRTLDVTKNLFEALLGIVGSEAIVIWIDAICINQADDEEKGWQVALMGDVYRNTSEVLAWLGPSADNSDTVLDHLNILGSISEACGLPEYVVPCIRVWEAIVTTAPSIRDFAEFISDQRVSLCLRALGILLYTVGGLKSHKHLIQPADLIHLVRRPWWERIWVLQEISLPKQAQFVCGTRRISRERFRAAFTAYDALLSVLGSIMVQQFCLSTYQMGFFNLSPTRVQLMLSMSNSYQAQDCSLVQILERTRYEIPGYDRLNERQSLNSTDPRDKIFALLGVVNDKEELKDLGVFPDYTKSKEEVYTTTMISLLKQGHVSLLSQARGLRRPGRLPSWVPDWSEPDSDAIRALKKNLVYLDTEFNACGLEKKCDFMLRYNNDGLLVMQIMSIICDEIYLRGHVCRISEASRRASSLEWLRAILQLTYSAKILYSNRKVRFQTVSRVSHAGTRFKTRNFPDKVEDSPGTIDLLEKIDRNGHYHDKIDGLEEILLKDTMEKPPWNGLSDSVSLQLELMAISEGRSPFVTSKGRLGIGSMDLREGDVIALISGAACPFILRPIGGRFMIVSEAYIDGIMEGEAAEDGQWDYIELE